MQSKLTVWGLLFSGVLVTYAHADIVSRDVGKSGVTLGMNMGYAVMQTSDLSSVKSSFMNELTEKLYGTTRSGNFAGGIFGDYLFQVSSKILL